MKKIEVIHQEDEINFADFTNDYLNHDEMSKINGGGLFCRTRKNCDDYTGSCTRISCGQWRETAASLSTD